MNRISVIVSAVVLSIFSCGCSKSPMHEDEHLKETIKIAVVLSEKDIERWERIMDFSRSNISEATDICPEFVFYEENSHDMMLLAYELARDESIISVIGCDGEENTDVLAYQMSRLKSKKPMFTFNTSQEVIRKYSAMGFMWCLCESDITQSEVILADIASAYPKGKISLVAHNGSYGQTFVDWFAFHALELGMTPVLIERYDHISEIEECINNTEEVGVTVLCVPNSAEEAIEMMKHTDHMYTYFSHKAFSNKVLEGLKINDELVVFGMEGATLVSDPASGFENIYKVRFGSEPKFGEAQLYDAIMITCLAYALSKEHDISVNKAVAELLDNECKGHGGWTKEGIRDSYNKIKHTKTIPAFNGATGKLAFDPDKNTVIQYSTYALKYLSYDGFFTTSYVSRGESNNNSSITVAWEWEKIFNQPIDESDIDPITSKVTGINPVIIATSRGWRNYRHQADALEFYQMFKREGFTDDQIILIMADDVADNILNPYPGKVFRKPDEGDLYDGVVVDYRLEDLKPEDLRDILLGNASERLPDVVNGGPHKNLMLFWSGHGRPGSLIWDEDETTITGEFLNSLIEEMHEKQQFRRMLAIIEACYSGSVASECEGTPGVLLLTAANALETSKAEVYDSKWGTYMTNSFTSAIITSLNKDTDPAISELYKDAFKMTMGSHVTMYNNSMFGISTKIYTSEFFSGIYNQY